MTIHATFTIRSSFHYRWSDAWVSLNVYACAHAHTHTHTLEFTCVWKYIFSLCMAVSPFFSPAWTMNWLSMFNSQFHHRLVRWSWQSYIPSLCFIDSFYIYSDGSKSFYNWICMRINWECVYKYMWEDWFQDPPQIPNSTEAQSVI